MVKVIDITHKKITDLHTYLREDVTEITLIDPNNGLKVRVNINSRYETQFTLEQEFPLYIDTVEFKGTNAPIKTFLTDKAP